MAHPVTSNPIGHPFIVLPTVDSTNNYAMAQVQLGGIFHGTTWFALEQTAGKGQRGKSWLTAPNENIMLSIVIFPPLKAAEKFLLSAVVALACYDFYKKYAGDETTVKWPNDLYWRDRKAGGILIENSFRGAEWLHAIVGIGININQTLFGEGQANAVSLKQITGKTFDIIQLAQELCRFIENRYQSLGKEKATAIVQQYEQALYKMNQPVKLKKGNRAFETYIKGVSPDGCLLTFDSIEHRFEFGEVEWII